MISAICPADSLLLMGKTCVKFNSNRKTKAEAASACQGMGGKLFNPVENDDKMVYSLVRSLVIPEKAVAANGGGPWIDIPNEPRGWLGFHHFYGF